MKHCPSCQTNYTDDTLKFCLQDGTPLTEIPSPIADTPTVNFGDEETIMASRRVEPIHVELPGLESYNRQPSQERVSAPVAQPRKSNTALIVLLTALVTVLVLGSAAWLMMKNRKTEVAVNVNTSTPRNNRPLNSNTASNLETNNQTANANATPTPSPNVATPKPMINPETAKAVTKDVENVIDDWKDSSENLDLAGHLSQYADTVDYYRAGRVGLAKVRADKERAFEQYDSINFNLSNMKVTPNETGDKATVVFDKEWKFEGGEKYSSGKVQQQLTLDKINGRWKITGERDLKVYYIDK
jgi:ketosteroid isomerase-like protein